jgi:CRP-like cAMP-binding protein
MRTQSVPANLSDNLLLAKLSPTVLNILRPNLHPVELQRGAPICEPEQVPEYGYFPVNGLLSVVSTMSDGSVIEVGAVGRDGMSGTHVFQGLETVPFRCFVQNDGFGFRIGMELLKTLGRQLPELQQHLLRYNGSLMVQMMQNTACNGLHSVDARCCRWLLMTRDRINSDDLHLTHEFLAHMLGVRRASVSEVLQPLRAEGVLDYTRGRITLLDIETLRSRTCECYKVITRELNWLKQPKLA